MPPAAPMAHPDPGAADAFDEVIASVLRGLDRVLDVTNAIVERVNGLLRSLPELVTSALRQVTEQLVDIVDRAVGALSELLHNAGQPSALLATGELWTASVGRPAGELAGLVDRNQLRADDHWSGAAAAAYAAVLPRQARALEGIKAASDTVHDVLVGLANAIRTYWTSMAIALGSLAVGLVSAALCVAGVVTAPGAVATAVAAVAVFLTFASDGVSAVVGHANDAQIRVADLQQLTTGHPAYPDGRWPVPTTDYRD